MTLNATRNLTVDTNGYVNVSNQLNSSGTITIQNNGQLIQVNDTDTNIGTYSGSTFNVIRNYTATDEDYVYWSSPTKLFLVNNLPTSYRYEWNPINNNSNGTQGNWISPTTPNMTFGKGYIARTFNGFSTPTSLPFTFRGQPNNGLISVDPHYRVLGFVNSYSNSENNDNLKINSIPIDKLDKFVKQNSVSEIVVASQKTDGITVDLYNQLIYLLENGYIIREYTQVYESITQRIPVQYVSRDFYRFFPFSRSNQNHLYLLAVRFLEILTSLVGIAFGIAILPIIIIGNLIGNRGSLFYVQERVGKNGKVFKIV